MEKAFVWILGLERYLIRHNGRRHGMMFEEMKSAENRVKKPLKYCRNNKIKI